MRTWQKRWSLPTILLLLVSVGLLATGIFCMVGFPGMFRSMLKDQFTILPGRGAYDAWLKPSIPTTLRFYFFSVLNPDQVILGGKPRLHEMGPYVFREEVERVEGNFSDDLSTVSYRTRKVWYPIEDESQPLDDLITTLDVPQLAAAESVRGQLMDYGMSWMLSYRPSLFIIKTARQLLFEGFPDTLMAMGSMFSKDTPIAMDRFGWFYKRNGTTWADDVIKMATGSGDYSRLGEIVEWKGRNRTHYPGQCGQLKGSAAGFMPINPDRQYIDFFSTDICRPIRLWRTNSSVWHNLDVTRFRVEPSLTFGNTSTNPENWCYHPNHPAGIHNATGCKDSGILPVFVSLPHFLGADPSYLEQFEPGSLDPQPSRHESIMLVNPNTSIPVKVEMRLQLIIHVRSNKNMGHNFAQLRDTFLPVLWFEAEASTTPAIDSQIWYLVHMVGILSNVGWGLVVLGGVLGLVLLGWLIRHLLQNPRGCGSENSSSQQEKKNLEELEQL